MFVKWKYFKCHFKYINVYSITHTVHLSLYVYIYIYLYNKVFFLNILSDRIFYRAIKLKLSLLFFNWILFSDGNKSNTVIVNSTRDIFQTTHFHSYVFCNFSNWNQNSPRINISNMWILHIYLTLKRLNPRPSAGPAILNRSHAIRNFHQIINCFPLRIRQYNLKKKIFSPSDTRKFAILFHLILRHKITILFDCFSRYLIFFF